MGVVLTESHAGQFRVREQAIRHVPARRHMVNADEVVMHDTEIVHADVGKLRAACHLADRPHAGRGRLQALVDLDVAAVGDLDAGHLQPQALGMRRAACGDQHMTALQGLLRAMVLEGDADRLSRCSRHTRDLRLQQQVDALVFEQAHLHLHLL